MEVGKEWLNRMYFGDCIKSLDTMPEKFVNTCVTSPPYFGLRDYGSGRWEGGDATHDHASAVGTRIVGRNDGGSDSLKQTPGDNKLMQTRVARPRNVVSNQAEQQQNEVVARRKRVGRSDTERKYGKKAQDSLLPVHDVQAHGVTCTCGAVWIDEQIGQEDTPEQFIDNLVNVFRAVRRVLRDDGTIWVNIGDSYCSSPKGNPESSGLSKDGKAVGKWSGDSNPYLGYKDRSKLPGLKQKDLIGIPWMLAFALRADGWYLRQDIIWSKPSCMPESIKDRCTKSHEYIFLLSKQERYYFDMDAIKEPSVSAGQYMKPYSGNGKASRALANGRTPSGNERPEAPPVLIKEMRHKRSVWNVSPKGYSGAHFATYPEELIEPCILAGAPARGVVLDPFMGSGTTAAVAARLERYWVGCELNDSNHFLQLERLGRTWLYEEKPSPRPRTRIDGEGTRVRL